jgi:hypothetical protein
MHTHLWWAGVWTAVRPPSRDGLAASPAAEASHAMVSVVQAPLLGVDDRKAAAEDQTAGWWCRWGCFPCAWSAGSPTTPGHLNR